MADTPTLRHSSAYLRNCIDYIEKMSVYGRDIRKPLYDVIQWIVLAAVLSQDQDEDYGLTVQNGMLCVVYEE